MNKFLATVRLVTVIVMTFLCCISFVIVLLMRQTKMQTTALELKSLRAFLKQLITSWPVYLAQHKLLVKKEDTWASFYHKMWRKLESHGELTSANWEMSNPLTTITWECLHTLAVTRQYFSFPSLALWKVLVQCTCGKLFTSTSL